MVPVTVRSNGSFRVEVEAGAHKFVSDEPRAAGGTDEGPTPYDLMSAALGACTSMTLHFLARRDGIPLDGVEVSVTNGREYAKDCADCNTQSGYIHRFDVKIRLRGSLSVEQRERLMSTAKRCPVYKTLTSEIRIDEQPLD
ncbi:MAG: hypothetical protein NVSMB68_13570 [Thermoanaerobaculia bacterium]